MKHLLKLLKPLFRFSYKYPYIVIFTAFVAAFFAAQYATKLKVDTDLANLLPKDFHSVQALERLKETVGGEISLDVAIKSESFEANKAFAEAVIEKALKLYDKRTKDFFFKRADYKRDVRVLEENALYFATPAEIEQIKRYLTKKIEQAKLEANPFYFDLEDEQDEDEEDLEQNNAIDFEENYANLVPREYPINADSTVMVIQLYPTGSKSDTRFLKDMFATFDSLIVAMNPKEYHQTMEVRFGGRLKRHVSELESIMNDVYSSFSTGISSVLLLVMMYFFVKKYVNYKRGAAHQQTHKFWEHIIRMPIPLLVIGLPLLLSLIYTFGITYVMYQLLNTMTSVLFVILFGMGIDYGIHFYARYLELRSAGQSVQEALEDTYDNTGVAIATSALTTAAAMYVLVYADFRGFSEFGFISGTGIVLALFCMIFILPAIVTLLERWGWILVNQNEEGSETVKKIPTQFPYSHTIIATSLLLMLGSFFVFNQIKFEYDFGKLEPEFPDYNAYLAFIGGGFESSLRNPAYILADSREEVVAITAKLRYIMENDSLSPTIRKIEALPERFPVTDEEKQAKLKSIAEIRQLLKDPFLVNNQSDAIKKLRKAAQTTKPLSLDSLPDFIRSKFLTKNGDIGNFVIVYPSVGLSDGRQSIAFKNDVGIIRLDNGKEFYAASTSIVAADMLDLMIQESPYMVTATLIIIFILMLIAFRSLRWTIIALLPLLVGLIWTFGLLVFLDIPLNFYNLIVLPAILGIGEDNGVHIAARYIEEGKMSMWNVLSSTGQHITISSVTTMLGYMGLLFTHHPGLYSIGQLATLGIGMTLLTALTLLPALIQFLENKNWIHFDRKGM